MKNLKLKNQFPEVEIFDSPTRRSRDRSHIREAVVRSQSRAEDTNHKILIVDDVPVFTEALEASLKKSGYRSERVLNGKEAIRRFRSEPFVLVITGSGMPDMDDTELIGELRKTDEFIEVILLSGYASLKGAVCAMRNVPCDYITRPFEYGRELDVIVGQAIEKRYLKIRNRDLTLELHREKAEKKREVETLRKRKNLLQSVFDGIREPMVMVSSDMELQSINQAGRRYFGLNGYDGILGVPCHQAFRGRTVPCDECRIRGAVEEMKTVSFERRGFIDPERWEQVVVYPCSGGCEQNPGGFAVYRITDITAETKVADEQKIRSDRLSSLERLSSQINHEIRNPLTAIRLFADILYGEADLIRNDLYREMLEEIQGNVGRIEKIIKRASF